MPSPAAPYLCSQLASVTKGLHKPLLPANRFLPTSEGTAADAAAYLSARHAPKHVGLFSLFFIFLLPPLVLAREEEKVEAGGGEERRGREEVNAKTGE